MDPNPLAPHATGTYVPLFCKSNYSFLQGASHPEELVEQAHALGLKALALTDRDGLYGVVRAHVRARELGIKLIIGAQITLFPEGAPPAMPVPHRPPQSRDRPSPTGKKRDKKPAPPASLDLFAGPAPSSALAANAKEQESEQQGEKTIVLLAMDQEGYRNLSRLLTLARAHSPKGSSHLTLSQVCQYAPGLYALCPEPFGPRQSAALVEAFGPHNCAALLRRHFLEEDAQNNQALCQWAKRHGLPLAAGHEVLYHDPERRPLHDVLTCISRGVRLGEAGRHLRPNSAHALESSEAFARRFADMPQAIAQSTHIAQRCQFNLDALRYRYPAQKLPQGITTMQWLRQLTQEGAHKRYGPHIPENVQTQLAHELALIEELDYCGYFLTMKELVDFCRARQILCQGRGSAANSAVCFCLGITAVDPVAMGLLFERFLSRERAEPPDIDLDIAHQRREEVIQHVYQSYGRRHAAMVANVIRYRPKSAVREVGKVLGLEETALDRLAKLLSHRADLSEELLVQAGFDPKAPVTGHLARLVAQIQDFPRHLSIHPGGFLLGHEPVSDLVPIEPASMPGRTVIQWDKYDVEALGLFKVDLLALGSLTLLDRCFQLLATHRGLALDMARLPQDDPQTFDMIGQADTVGVFQIDSRAQMNMLPRLKPRCYYDLVIEISLVRPGPITGEMVHPYLRRRQGLEEVDYPHPMLEPVLRRTLGIPLFQEQVMRLAILAADYTPGEADQLRRDMAAWKKQGRLEHHRERMIPRMVQKGIDPDFAERVFNQIQGFADYGFPESHAASFALISYATAYLRCHYPVEFTCALLNAQPTGFYSVATIVGDARRRQVPMLPIDVCHSQWDCTVQGPLGGPQGPRAGVRMGGRYLKGFAREAWHKLEEARHARPFASLEDLVDRAGLTRPELAKLAQAGALQGLGGTRREALWQVRGLVFDRAHQSPLAPSEPEEDVRFAPLSPMENIAWDWQTKDHSTLGHPLGPLRPHLRQMGTCTAAELGHAQGTVHLCGLVICRQRPSTASGVVFMTLEDETGLANVIIWPKVYERYALIIKTTAFLGITGQVQYQDGVVHLIAHHIWQPDLSVEARPESRDFH